MLKRTISGAFFIAIITAFFFLRQTDVRLFQILVWFFCAVGTFEVARAVKEHTNKIQFITAVVLGTLLIPVYGIFNYFIIPGLGFAVSLGLIAVCTIISLIFRKKDGELNDRKGRFYYSVLPTLYPSVLLLIMAMTSDIGGVYGLIALLITFVVSPCCDTFAYLVGMLFNKIKKGNTKKLCPRLSPKKTWAGAIGGVVGGMVGALVLYFIFAEKVTLGWWLFLIIGGVASVLTQIGDLFESSIKRRVGIKDMGKIMPGHGGVMDRIDGIVFASLFTFIIFSVV